MPPIAASVPAAAPLTGTPTPASVPPNASGVELDAQGLPWDGRIHGATKAKNDDGKWRQKRGLNDLALKARVEAELRAGQAARVPAGLSVAPPATIPVFVPAAPAAVTPPPPFVATVPAAPVTAPETFGLLMARLAPRMQTDPAAAAVINTVLGQFALTSLAQLGARPDLVAPVAMCVDQALGVAA